jgi:hypothetical protein
MFTTRHTVDKSKRLSLLKVVFAFASALLALELLAVAQSGRVDSRGGLAAPIEGTWIVKIHRVEQDIDFSALQSFTAGGVTLATGTIDRTPPPPISPLYGSWRRMHANSYAATICFFAFDSAGNAVAMIKTPEALQLTDDNNLVGSGTALACDINGDNCVNVPMSITFTGKRLIAQGPSN